MDVFSSRGYISTYGVLGVSLTVNGGGRGGTHLPGVSFRLKVYKGPRPQDPLDLCDAGQPCVILSHSVRGPRKKQRPRGAMWICERECKVAPGAGHRGSALAGGHRFQKDPGT